MSQLPPFEPEVFVLRNRAAIAIMAYTFVRVSAIVGLNVGDYRHEARRARQRLMEKGNHEKSLSMAESVLSSPMTKGKAEPRGLSSGIPS